MSSPSNESVQKKRKIIIRADDDDIDAIENAREKKYREQRTKLIWSVRDAVEKLSSYNKSDGDLMKEIDQIECKIKQLREFIVAGVDEVDFDEIDE